MKIKYILDRKDIITLIYLLGELKCQVDYIKDEEIKNDIRETLIHKFREDDLNLLSNIENFIKNNECLEFRDI